MGFSGKPSKGCAPCRQVRTKCDLVKPSCTQCVRKNRICSGYRQEENTRFVNETNLVVRKATRKTDDQPQQSFSVDRFILDMLDMQQPSRQAALDDEAMMHFFANYNKKFFPGEGQPGESGIEYMLPLYQKDSTTGGTVSEIIRASGLAALGNRRSNPKLLITARAKQVKVLQQLNLQLQDPKSAFTESSLLTVVMLGVFENIIWDSPRSLQIRTSHVLGAVTLAELIGPSKLRTGTVGRGIFLRIRENTLANCFLNRDRFPETLLEAEDDEQQDGNRELWKLLSRLCQVRFDHKTKGSVDEDMAKEAQCIMDELAGWEQNIAVWTPSDEKLVHPKDPHHHVWLWTHWMVHQTARILASDIVINRARAQALLTASISNTAILEDAISYQAKLCDVLRKKTESQLDEFKSMRAGVATIASYDLLWPLFILATSASTTADTTAWIIRSSDEIAEKFGIRQAKLFGDSMRQTLMKLKANEKTN